MKIDKATRSFEQRLAGHLKLMPQDLAYKHQAIAAASWPARRKRSGLRPARGRQALRRPQRFSVLASSNGPSESTIIASITGPHGWSAGSLPIAPELSSVRSLKDAMMPAYSIPWAGRLPTSIWEPPPLSPLFAKTYRTARDAGCTVPPRTWQALSSAIGENGAALKR